MTTTVGAAWLCTGLSDYTRGGPRSKWIDKHTPMRAGSFYDEPDQTLDWPPVAANIGDARDESKVDGQPGARKGQR